MSKKNNPGKTESMQIPDYAIERMARCLLPMIQRYYESEEGQRELRQWEAQRKAKEDKHGYGSRTGTRKTGWLLSKAIYAS